MNSKFEVLRTALAISCALTLIPAAANAAAPRKTRAEGGTIKTIDANAHMLVVTTAQGKSESKFQWNDQTKFTERGKPVTPTDIKPGESIRFIYTQDGAVATIRRAILGKTVAVAKPLTHSAKGQKK